MNIGAGRVVEMDLRKIEGAIERDEFAALPGIVRFADHVAAGSGVAHLCGVLSDGGVHSHVDHMIETAKHWKRVDCRCGCICLATDVMLRPNRRKPIWRICKVPSVKTPRLSA